MNDCGSWKLIDSMYAMGKGSDRMLVLEVDEEEKREKELGGRSFMEVEERIKTVSTRAAASWLSRIDASASETRHLEATGRKQMQHEGMCGMWMTAVRHDGLRLGKTYTTCSEPDASSELQVADVDLRWPSILWTIELTADGATCTKD